MRAVCECERRSSFCSAKLEILEPPSYISKAHIPTPVLLMHSAAHSHSHTHTKQVEREKSRILSPARNKSAELWKRRSSSRIIKSIELQNESAAALILQLQHHVRRFPKHLSADKWTCAYKELRRQYLAKKRSARSLQLISCATHFYSSSRTHHPPIFAPPRPAARFNFPRRNSLPVTLIPFVLGFAFTKNGRQNCFFYCEPGKVKNDIEIQSMFTKTEWI